MTELIKAAKIIQSRLEKFADREGGARVWLSEYNTLYAMIWTHRAEGLNPTERQNLVKPFFNHSQLFTIKVLTPDEYEEKYFFTKPPFCEEG